MRSETVAKCHSRKHLFKNIPPTCIQSSAFKILLQHQAHRRRRRQRGGDGGRRRRRGWWYWRHVLSGHSGARVPATDRHPQRVASPGRFWREFRFHHRAICLVVSFVPQSPDSVPGVEFVRRIECKHARLTANAQTTSVWSESALQTSEEIVSAAEARTKASVKMFAWYKGVHQSERGGSKLSKLHGICMPDFDSVLGL